MKGERIEKTPDRPELVRIPLAQLVSHPLNPNVMPDALKGKLKANIRASGRYPPLIVRPLDDGTFQIMDGHQRADVLRELGESTAVCYAWPASDEEALLLLATLNRLEGQDIPGRRAALIAELQAHETLAELARLLPEDEAQLEATLELLDFDVEGLLARLTEEADRAAAEGPQLFTFAVDAEDAPTVEAAIARAAATLSGHNCRGRALVIVVRSYLSIHGRNMETTDG
jgi:ParB-like chromosome segregation protein Spo0J